MRTKQLINWKWLGTYLLEQVVLGFVLSILSIFMFSSMFNVLSTIKFQDVDYGFMKWIIAGISLMPLECAIQRIWQHHSKSQDSKRKENSK